MLQSPFGEMVLQLIIYSVMHDYVLQKFQSPFGEMVLQRIRRNDRRKSQSVSVPFRGNGTSTTNFWKFIQALYLRFQSPFGEMVLQHQKQVKAAEKWGVSVPFRGNGTSPCYVSVSSVLFVSFQSPFGEMVLHLSNLDSLLLNSASFSPLSGKWYFTP